MKGYNNSIAAAALLLGISPEMLMKCLEGSTAIAEMQLKIDALNLHSQSDHLHLHKCNQVQKLPELKQVNKRPSGHLI